MVFALFVVFDVQYIEWFNSVNEKSESRFCLFGQLNFHFV